MTDPLGEFLRDGSSLGLRYERHIRRSPDVVWRAITESDHLQHWLPCDIVGDRRAGADVALPFWKEHVQRYAIPADQAVLPGHIRVWDPPRVFEWTWDSDVLRFELDAEASGTRLVFTTWFGPSGDFEAPSARVAAGYDVCLSQLTELVETGTVAAPLIDRATSPLEERYVNLLAASQTP